MADEYLVRGALLKCDKSPYPRSLNLPVDHATYASSGHPMVHEYDCKVGDNIPSFVYCMINGGTCIPVILKQQWFSPHPTETVSDNGADYHALTLNSFLVCASGGGQIEPLTSGQGTIGAYSDIIGELVKNWTFPDGNTGDAIVYTNAEGVQFVYPAGYLSTAPINPEKAMGLYDQLPAALRPNIKTVTFMDVANPDDDYWKKEYNNPNHVSAATGGGGNITFWQAGQNNTSDATLLYYMQHEAAHNLDQQLGGGAYFSYSLDWGTRMFSDAISSGKASPTDYGKNSPAEDFAESVTEYLKNPEAFKKDFPERWLYLQGVLE